MDIKKLSKGSQESSFRDEKCTGPTVTYETSTDGEIRKDQQDRQGDVVGIS